VDDVNVIFGMDLWSFKVLGEVRASFGVVSGHKISIRGNQTEFVYWDLIVVEMKNKYVDLFGTHLSSSNSDQKQFHTTNEPRLWISYIPAQVNPKIARLNTFLETAV
jgi:hypothetical protein